MLQLQWGLCGNIYQNYKYGYFGLTIQFLGIYSTDILGSNSCKMCIVAKEEQQPKYPVVKNWLNKIGLIHAAEYHFSVQKNKKAAPGLTCKVPKGGCAKVFRVYYCLCKKGEKQEYTFMPCICKKLRKVTQEINNSGYLAQVGVKIG